MRFCISAPNRNSASMGISVLYQLCDDLKSIGYNAEILLWSESHYVSDNDILIYPEIITGNPLQAKNVVRYVLHREAVLTGKPMEAQANDFIFAWYKMFYPNAHASLHKFLINDSFNDKDTKFALNRCIDCTFIGKGLNGSIIENTLEINKTNPISKQALAELLRNTRFLYTYDTNTALIYEAIYCGAMVIPMQWYPFEEEEWKRYGIKYPYINRLDNNVVIPIDYVEERQKFITDCYNANATYLTKLDIIAKQILEHFNYNIIS